MTITLPIISRDEAVSINKLRDNGSVPAVIYGPKQEPINISLDAKAFDKLRKTSGESTIIELTGLDKPIEVLIKGVDFNPMKKQVMHVDFYAIERGKEMTVHVALEFTGEAPVEHTKEGSVTKVLHEVEVTCMPNNLPSHIEVDLSTLITVEDKIHIKDLKVGKGVTILADAEDSVVVVTPAKSEVEAEEEEANAVDMSAVEVEKKGKEDSEEENSK